MYDVKTLVKLIAGTLAQNQELRDIYVLGELSNFTQQKSGHFYFTIKDDESRLSCVMFKFYAAKLTFIPKDGMKVIISGDVTLFEAGGQLQLNVRSIRPDGLGQLYLQFEATKNKLQKEGLFDQVYKKSIPTYPFSIGIVVGKDSAAEADIKTNLARRWPVANVVYYESAVQGINAVNELIDHLTVADQRNHDLLIIARGGGSFEDLNAFNNEELCRFIFNLKTPIISGIGHESDYTLVDFVADLRAPTPTAAVVLGTPEIKNVRATINQYRQSIIQAMLLISGQQSMKLQYMQSNLVKYSNVYITKRHEFMLIKDRLVALANNYNERLLSGLKSCRLRMESGIVNTKVFKEQQLIQQIVLLDAFSPLKILSRGYSIVNLDQTIVTSIKQTKVGDIVNIRLADGILQSRIIDKEI
jgi:exodeoxyribonuclease VII large subunit